MQPTQFLSQEGLSSLVDELVGAGYAVFGPQVRDGAVVFNPLTNADALPRGVGDIQGPGHYRLSPAANDRRFAYACGPQAIKPLLFAGYEPLWRAVRDERGFHAEALLPDAENPLAVIGARACDLAALALHDAHFLKGEYPDAAYGARRAGLFVVAVNCSHPSATCFCASTGDGPDAHNGYDLLMDELDEGFVVCAGSDAGKAIISRLPTEPVSPALIERANQQRRAAAAAQTRHLPGRDLRRVLSANLEHPRWDQVATRCLSCGNCTSVCPSCFCHTHVEVPALDGSVSHHYRAWDSCFTEGHSYIHGIVIRADTRQRYRQWLSHKLNYWHEQFGRSGCVGCGRCITWCPAGIDITEEAAAIVGEKA